MLTVPRDEDAGTWPVRGRWRAIRAEGQRSAIFCCPNCGELGRIAGRYVAPDGRVQANVLCETTDCGFNEFIKLDGWVPQ
jgi:hypothetical protein